MFFYSGGQSDHDRSGAWAYQGRAKVWGLAETKGDWIKPSSYISLFMSKVVTYWLAKLLDPQHTVVLSDEHQDFQVAYLAWLLTKLDIYRSFFLVGELWDCLPVGGGVPRHAAAAQNIPRAIGKCGSVEMHFDWKYKHCLIEITEGVN